MPILSTKAAEPAAFCDEDGHLQGRGLFKHKPLDSRRAIRLLTVLPGSYHAAIRCVIQEQSIRSLHRDKPKYTAISYCWGGQKETQTISINDCTHMTTDNASKIIRSVRDEQSTKTIWIDAICINQSDDGEKSRQIRLMTEVYTRARQTVVWLGDRSEDSDMALDHVARLQKALNALRGTGPILENDLLEALSLDRAASQWTALGRLLERPWFSRTWVLQEVALSANVLVVCGERTIEWEDLAKPLAMLSLQRLTNLIQTTIPRRGINLLTMDNLRQTVTFRHNKLSLHKALRITRSSAATNERDFVLGLFGVVAPEHLRQLNIGYTDTVEQVYQAATEQALMTSGSLETIHAAGISDRSSAFALPSWVPDFSTGSNWKSVPFGFTAPYSKQQYLAGGLLTDNGLQPFAFEEGKLIICGTLPQKVLKLSSICIPTPETVLDGPLMTVPYWIDEAVQMANASDSRDGKQAHETLGRVLCADTMFRSGPDSDSRYSEHLEAYQNLLLPSGLDNVEPSRGAFDMVFADPSASEHRKHQAYSYMQSLIRTTLGRRFCVTNAGRWGLVPNATGIEDEICIVPGATVPFIVRKAVGRALDSNEYLLVGTCYIEGLMDGEGLAFRHQEIVLI